MMTQPVSPEDALKASLGEAFEAGWKAGGKAATDAVVAAFTPRTDPPKTVLDEEVAAVLEAVINMTDPELPSEIAMFKRARALLTRLKDCGTD